MNLVFVSNYIDRYGNALGFVKHLFTVKFFLFDYIMGSVNKGLLCYRETHNREDHDKAMHPQSC